MMKMKINTAIQKCVALKDYSLPLSQEKKLDEQNDTFTSRYYKVT